MVLLYCDLRLVKHMVDCYANIDHSDKQILLSNYYTFFWNFYWTAPAANRSCQERVCSSPPPTLFGVGSTPISLSVSQLARLYCALNTRCDTFFECPHTYISHRIATCYDITNQRCGGRKHYRKL